MTNSLERFPRPIRTSLVNFFFRNYSSEMDEHVYSYTKEELDNVMALSRNEAIKSVSEYLNDDVDTLKRKERISMGPRKLIIKQIRKNKTKKNTYYTQMVFLQDSLRALRQTYEEQISELKRHVKKHTPSAAKWELSEIIETKKDALREASFPTDIFIVIIRFIPRGKRASINLTCHIFNCLTKIY